jgi:hypothetical protein
MIVERDGRAGRVVGEQPPIIGVRSSIGDA